MRASEALKPLKGCVVTAHFILAYYFLVYIIYHCGMSSSVKLYIQYLYVYFVNGTLGHLGTKRLQSNNLVSSTCQSDKTRCMLKDILIFYISNIYTLCARIKILTKLNTTESTECTIL